MDLRCLSPARAFAGGAWPGEAAANWRGGVPTLVKRRGPAGSQVVAAAKNRRFGV